MSLCSVWVECHSTRKTVVPYAGAVGFQRGHSSKTQGNSMSKSKPAFLGHLWTTSLRKHRLLSGQSEPGFLLPDLRRRDGRQMQGFSKVPAVQELAGHTSLSAVI